MRNTFQRLLMALLVCYVFTFNNNSNILAAATVPDNSLEAPTNLAQLDIDLIYDSNPAVFDRNINLTIDYLVRSNAKIVVLQTFADNDASGNIREVYFATDKTKVKANVFGFITQKLQAQGFEVYAWLPTLAFQFLTENHPEDKVIASPQSKIGWYLRATPFSSRVRTELKELAVDLAKNTTIDGVLFQDDLYLNDFEDYSPAAKETFAKHFDKKLTAKLLKNNSTVEDKWVNIKTKVLNDLTQEIISAMKFYHPNLKTARNIYPSLLTEPKSQLWFAQSMDTFIENYDYTVVMVYPAMEQAKDPLEWVENISKIAMNYPNSREKIILKLQNYDWRTESWIAPEILQKEIQIMKNIGAINFAYYPLNVYDKKSKLYF